MYVLFHAALACPFYRTAHVPATTTLKTRAHQTARAMLDIDAYRREGLGEDAPDYRHYEKTGKWLTIDLWGHWVGT